MELVFRKAVPQDAPELARLVVLAWRKAYRGILSDQLLENRSTETGAQRFREGIQGRPEFQYYVLEADAKIAGVSVVCPSSDADLPGAAAIQVFYIHPDDQRKGLGRALMRHTLAAMRADGAKRIILWVLKENHNARAFYEAMGFHPDGAEKAVAHLEHAPEVRYRYQTEDDV